MHCKAQQGKVRRSNHTPATSWSCVGWWSQLAGTGAAYAADVLERGTAFTQRLCGRRASHVRPRGGGSAAWVATGRSLCHNEKVTHSVAAICCLFYNSWLLLGRSKARQRNGWNCTSLVTELACSDVTATACLASLRHFEVRRLVKRAKGVVLVQLTIRSTNTADRWHHQHRDPGDELISSSLLGTPKIWNSITPYVGTNSQPVHGSTDCDQFCTELASA